MIYSIQFLQGEKLLVGRNCILLNTLSSLFGVINFGELRLSHGVNNILAILFILINIMRLKFASILSLSTLSA